MKGRRDVGISGSRGRCAVEGAVGEDGWLRLHILCHTEGYSRTSSAFALSLWRRR